MSVLSKHFGNLVTVRTIIRYVLLNNLCMLFPFFCLPVCHEYISELTHLSHLWKEGYSRLLPTLFRWDSSWRHFVLLFSYKANFIRRVGVKCLLLLSQKRKLIIPFILLKFYVERPSFFRNPFIYYRVGRVTLWWRSNFGYFSSQITVLVYTYHVISHPLRSMFCRVFYITVETLIFVVYV